MPKTTNSTAFVDSAPAAVENMATRPGTLPGPMEGNGPSTATRNQRAHYLRGLRYGTMRNMARSGPDPTSFNTYVINTPRLAIEPPVRAHALALYGMAGGADRHRVTEGLLWDGPDSVDEVLEWVERQHSQPYSAGGFGWVILDRSGEVSGTSGNPLGSITLRPHHFPGRCTVGYWLGTEHWRQGVMSEALSGVIDFAFGDLGIVKIEAEVFSRNTPGRALVESLGMKQEAEIRRAVLKRGEWLDELTYGILPDEWSKPLFTTA